MSKVQGDVDGIWRTVSGRRVFIKRGQSLSEAMKESRKFDDSHKDDISFTSEITKKEIISKYNLKEDEVKTVEDYTGIDYDDINSQLWDNEGDVSKCSKSVQDSCQKLDSVLEKLPNYDGIVHRKESFSRGSFYKEGKVYENLGYTSTTAWSEMGGGTILEIQQSKGCNISKLSRSPGENEVLLPRGFRYIVTKIEKTESGYTRVYAKEVE